MRSQQREEYLIRKATEIGFVSISEAAERLDVSIETIRRDINKLHREGQLRKVRGGAEPAKRLLRKDAPYAMRININAEEKASVGQIAAQMIRSGTVVGLDFGVSVQTMATFITDVQNVTFITNSLPIAVILADKLSCKEITGRLILIGGEFNIQNRFSRGALATEALSEYNFDQAFLSCTALSAQGVSSYDIDASVFAAHLTKRASQTVLLAESDKLGKQSVRNYANVTDFDYIILDDKFPLPKDLVKKLETTRTELILVPCHTDD